MVAMSRQLMWITSFLTEEIRSSSGTRATGRLCVIHATRRRQRGSMRIRPITTDSRDALCRRVGRVRISVRYRRQTVAPFYVQNRKFTGPGPNGSAGYRKICTFTAVKPLVRLLRLFIAMRKSVLFLYHFCKLA